MPRKFHLQRLSEGWTGGELTCVGYFGAAPPSTPGFAIIGGYRLFEVRGEEDSSFAKLRLSGPFVGATLRF